MKSRILLVFFAVLLLGLGACSGETDNSLPADTPIKFSGGSATIHKFISDSAVGHASIDRNSVNVMAIQFAYTLEPNAGPDSLDDLAAKSFLAAKDGSTYPGIKTVTITNGDMHIVTMVFGVPKNIQAGDLKLKAGDALVKLPKAQ